jgi:hypothetical protein
MRGNQREINQRESSTESVSDEANSGIAMVKPLESMKSTNAQPSIQETKNLNGDVQNSDEEKLDSLEILQRYLVNVDDVVSYL